LLGAGSLRQSSSRAQAICALTVTSRAEARGERKKDGDTKIQDDKKKEAERQKGEERKEKEERQKEEERRNAKEKMILTPQAPRAVSTCPTIMRFESHNTP